MAQRSQMYYAYFRFYIDESEIIAGMNKFCTGWEHMFEVGYNYREYKCFVDNIGGFEHWVGDMRGYISPTREIGFIDGSPSDAVFDQTLTMGAERVIVDDVEILNAYCPSTKMIIRKITANDAGIAHKVKFSCGADQSVNHPVMYTLDHTQIEIIDQVVGGIVDSSDVDSYSIMADMNKTLLTGIEDNTTSPGVMTDFDLMFNRSDGDFAKLTSPGVDTTTVYTYIDMGDFSNIYCEIYNWNNAVEGKTSTTIAYAKTIGGSYTTLISTGNNEGGFNAHAVDKDARFVKITNDCVTDWHSRSDIFRLMCS